MLLREARSHPGRLGRVKVIESVDMSSKDVLSVDIETTDLQIVTYALDQVRWVVHDKYLAIVMTEEWVVDGDAKECFEQVDVGRSLITDHQQHCQANPVKFADARL